ELAERRKPNVVIMDVRMPGMDGLEATKILTERVPGSAVLIFTAYSERSLLSRGLESGAKGYVLKEAPHETLLRAIEKVASGEGYVDPALMPAFLTGRGKDDMLTTREREILQPLAGVALMLDALLDLMEKGDMEQARNILDRALIRTRATVGELRDLSFNLEPVVLRDLGFAAAVDALGQTRAAEHKIEVSLDVS